MCIASAWPEKTFHQYMEIKKWEQTFILFEGIAELHRQRCVYKANCVYIKEIYIYIYIYMCKYL